MGCEPVFVFLWIAVATTQTGTRVPSHKEKHLLRHLTVYTNQPSPVNNTWTTVMASYSFDITFGDAPETRN